MHLQNLQTFLLDYLKSHTILYFRPLFYLQNLNLFRCHFWENESHQGAISFSWFAAGADSHRIFLRQDRWIFGTEGQLPCQICLVSSMVRWHFEHLLIDNQIFHIPSLWPPTKPPNPAVTYADTKHQGRLFWITCKWLKILRKASHLQVIQNSGPSVFGSVNVTSKFCCQILKQVTYFQLTLAQRAVVVST